MTLLGVFDDDAKAADAIAAIRGLDLDASEIVAYSPTPSHAIDQALEMQHSPVRTFTLVGGVLGGVCGFALPIYTVLDWPLLTGGKPLISIPPFVVIAFELTILFGALAAMGGFLLLSGLPSLRAKAVDDPRFTNDRFGVRVQCAPAHADAVERCMSDAGAEEVTRGA